MSSSGDEKKSIDVKASLEALKQQKREQSAQESYKPEQSAKLGTKVGKKTKDVSDAILDLTKTLRDANIVGTSDARRLALRQETANKALENTIKTVEGNTYQQGSRSPYYTLADGTPITNAMVDQWKRDLESGKSNLVDIQQAAAQGETNKAAYNKAIRELEQQSLRPEIKEPITYKTQEIAKAETQIQRLNTLQKQGIVTKDGDTYTLTKAAQFLSDKEEKQLKDAGFDLPSLGKTLSYRLLEEAEIKPTKATGILGIKYSPKGAKQAAAFAVSGVETFLSQFSNLFTKEDFGKLDVRGKKSANIDYIEQYMPNFTVGEKYAAKALGYGTATGLNAVTMSAVSYALGTVVGAGGTAVADKLKTPIGKASVTAKIASKIAENPTGAKVLTTLGGIAQKVSPYVGVAAKVGESALVVGPTAFVEYKKVKTLCDAGQPWENVAGHLFMDAGSIAGFSYGLGRGIEKGKDIYSKGKFLLSKDGKIIDASKVVPESVRSGEATFPSFKGEKLAPTRENYIKLAQQYTPDEIRIGEGIPSWSASSDPFNTVFDVKTGLNKRGEAGMFFSYGGSEYFLRLGDEAAYSLSPGLPRFNASPQWVYSEFTDVIETNFNKKAAGGMGALLDELQGTGVLVMPAKSIQIAEGQAILSGGTRMVEVQGGNFWMQHGGRLVKIGRYLPEVTAKELGVPYITGSTITFEQLMKATSSGGVSVNPSTYLPVAFPMVSSKYPDVNKLITSLSGMSESELKSWASSASPEELASILSVINSSKVDVSYSVAYALASPTIVSVSSELSEDIVNQSSNLVVDYGSVGASQLSGISLTLSDLSYTPSDVSTTARGGKFPNQEVIRQLRGFEPETKYRVTIDGGKPVIIKTRGYPDAVQKALRQRGAKKKLPKEIEAERIR